MAWLQQQSIRERPDTFAQTALGNRSRTLHRRGEPYISREGFLQDQLVQRELGDGLLQPLVLAFEILQPFGLVEFQSAVLPAPLVVGLLRDTEGPFRTMSTSPFERLEIARFKPNPGLASGEQVTIREPPVTNPSEDVVELRFAHHSVAA